jgi:MFS family permease
MSLASLTITVYMAVQGVAPSFWGSLADAVGRRPIFVGTFIVYLIANVVLGVSNNYAEVMAFRALQAAGSAATISIGECFPCSHGTVMNNKLKVPQVQE